jgi:hypothetical protein
MHSEAPHRVWAPWNHPATTTFGEYLTGPKMLEDNTAVRGAMLDALPALVSPASLLQDLGFETDRFAAVPPYGFYNTTGAVATRLSVLLCRHQRYSLLLGRHPAELDPLPV